ncbi:hypothetical protein P7K49_016260 [Saguinus oedipus]|uniref:Ig-like domain-containing protein n=1 Tax=Saguinus oedipus TaxID=9490 RepID=A0ABQ9VC48_SAGOE|nr:hypothetical protein P7K49_016260 [Saguinus oedipus]
MQRRSKVNVSKVHWTKNVTEHSEVAIHCSLESAGSSAALYSVMWYRNRENTGSQMLVNLQYDGLLDYGEEGLRRHLHCYRSSPTDFVLELQQVEMEDTGMYWCRVAEWQLHGHRSKWVNQASDESQRMVLMVLPSGNQGFIYRELMVRRIYGSPLMLSLSAMFCSFFTLKAMFRFPKEDGFAVSLNSSSFEQTRSM